MFNKRLFSLLMFLIVIFSMLIPFSSPEQLMQKPDVLAIDAVPSFAELSFFPLFHNFSQQYPGVIVQTSFEIWNSGCCGLTYSLIEDYDWVRVDPTSGQSYGEKDQINVTINTTGLGTGTYTGEILIDSSESDAVFLIQVTVIDPPNHPPFSPRISGPSSGGCDRPQLFTANTTDVDGDQLWYQWDFDDGNRSEWIGPVENNASCEITYTWKKKGTYQIQVRAKDEHDALSDWSDPFSIKMTKQKLWNEYVHYIISWIYSFIY